MKVFVDADACPVKQEIYRVAGRYGLEVIVVSNSLFSVPQDPLVRLEIVKEGMDAADDWIADHAEVDDIVITGDIPLASRALRKGAHALGFGGRPFTLDNIGDALATRDLLSSLRDRGEMSGGPAPFDRRDRSRFLQGLDETIQRVRRNSGSEA